MARNMYRMPARKVTAWLIAVLVLLVWTSACNVSRSERHYRRGVRHMLKGQSAKAIEEFNKALRYHPGYSQALLQLAAIYETEGALDKACGAYQELMRIDPSRRSEYDCRRAKLYYRLGRVQEAEDCFNDVLRTDPNHADAHYGLATIYRQRNQHEQARHAYLQAVACDAHQYEAHYALAVIYYTEGQFARARVHASQAIARFPSAAKLLALIEEEQSLTSGRM